MPVQPTYAFIRPRGSTWRPPSEFSSPPDPAVLGSRDVTVSPWHLLGGAVAVKRGREAVARLPIACACHHELAVTPRRWPTVLRRRPGDRLSRIDLLALHGLASSLNPFNRHIFSITVAAVGVRHSLGLRVPGDTVRRPRTANPHMIYVAPDAQGSIL